MGWDWFQANLEQQDRIDRGGKSPSYGGADIKCRTPSPPRAIILDGLDYKIIDPVVFDYPPHICVDDTRVGALNRRLLNLYTDLAKSINCRERCNSILAKNRSSAHFYQVQRLESDVQRAKADVNAQINLVAFAVGEVDAISSSDSYFVPSPLRDELQEVFEKGFLVPTGSLTQLAGQPPYFPEICDVPVDVYMGDDTHAGRLNVQRKKHIEAIATSVNRIIYLEACESKADQMLALHGKLLEDYYKVSFEAGSDILNIPDDLRQEAVRVLSSFWDVSKKPDLGKETEAVESATRKRVLERLEEKCKAEEERSKKLAQDR